MVKVALYSIKGGVGKTASAVNLAYLSSRDGYVTLLWDLDPQGATSYYLKAQAKRGKTKKVFRGKMDLTKMVRGTEISRLDTIAADFSYRNLDLMLDGMKKSRKRLNAALHTVRKDYNVVFLDAPPSITLLAENIFFAVDLLLVPVIPTTLSMRALESLRDFFLHNDLDLKRIIPFFSMVDRRKKIHRDILEDPKREEYGFLATEIPYSSEVEKMGVRQEPLPQFGAKSKAGRSLEDLWGELAGRFRG